LIGLALAVCRRFDDGAVMFAAVRAAPARSACHSTLAVAVMKRRFITLNVFTDRRFAGNPLAMVLDSQGLGSVTMQTIAREFGHPETVFMSPAVDPAHKASMRIFTPASELPFAGHPTVGAAVGLACLSGDARRQSFVLEEKVGPVACSAQSHGADSGQAEFRLPRLPEAAGALPDIATMAGALCLDPADIAPNSYPASRWSAGIAYSFVSVRSREAIARAMPDMSKFEKVFGIGGPAMVCVICTDTVEEGHHLHARMFAPGNGIPEDPATGSAVAAFAGLHVAHSRPSDGEHRLVIEQGYEMGRPSLMRLSLTVANGRLVEASIGGNAVIVTEGTIEA
jgi:trans-2,3-dihydro-3-hydroxyanthranilate isomerase